MTNAPHTIPGFDWRRGEDEWHLWEVLKNDGTEKRSRYVLSVPNGPDINPANLADSTGNDLSDGLLPVPAASGNSDGARVDGDVIESNSVGGQVAETDRPPVGNEPKKRKPRAKKNVLSFKLPTGGQKKASGRKQKTSPKLPTGGQSDETEWLKSLLPIAKTGDWWETPADDKGFKIKLRWRVGTQKGTYVFRRLGKRNIETMKEESYEQQVWLIADRIFGELRSEGRTDVAARLGARPVFNQVAGAEG